MVKYTYMYVRYWNKKMKVHTCVCYVITEKDPTKGLYMHTSTCTMAKNVHDVLSLDALEMVGR